MTDYKASGRFRNSTGAIEDLIGDAVLLFEESVAESQNKPVIGLLIAVLASFMTSTSFICMKKGHTRYE